MMKDSKMYRVRICNFLKIWLDEFSYELKGASIEKFKGLAGKALQLDGQVHSKKMLDDLKRMVNLVFDICNQLC